MGKLALAKIPFFFLSSFKWETDKDWINQFKKEKEKLWRFWRIENVVQNGQREEEANREWRCH